MPSHCLPPYRYQSYSSFSAFNSSIDIDAALAAVPALFLNLTPAPPPFSAMNSTPAASRARRLTQGCRSRQRGASRL